MRYDGGLAAKRPELRGIMGKAHPFWGKKPSLGREGFLFMAARTAFAKARRANALESPPRGDEELRLWIALACLAGDLEALSALSKEAGPSAFVFGPDLAAIAAEAAYLGPEASCGEAFWEGRSLSAWHLALMASHMLWRHHEELDLACCGWLAAHPASRLAIALAPCPEAIACVEPSLGDLRAWSKAIPEIAGAQGGSNLAKAMVAARSRQAWEVCLGMFGAGKALRAELTAGEPSALDLMASGPVPERSPGIEAKVAAVKAKHERMELGKAAKAGKGPSASRRL